jgi:RTX calcium-binding nonapeptide repeat (4 copies)
MASLNVSAHTDYRGQNLSDITTIQYFGPYIAHFGSDQFDFGEISTSVNILGDAGANVFRVTVAPRLSLDASGWSFAPSGATSWDPTDLVVIEASSGTDTIIGSSQRDDIVGLSGGDQVNAGAGDDSLTFRRPPPAAARSTAATASTRSGSSSTRAATTSPRLP